MTTNVDVVPSGITVRTDPVQARSAQRIALLLDAAAGLIDRAGIDGVTTSEVASAASSSVGVVYRYFTDIQSLLRALAARNMDRFTERIFRILDDEPADWTQTLDRVIDAYIDLMRNEPGFRALRLGQIIDERSLQTGPGNSAVLAEQFADLLTARYELQNTGRLRFDIEVAVEIADALLQRAFAHDPDGDERFIDQLRGIVRDYLGKYEPSRTSAS